MTIRKPFVVTVALLTLGACVSSPETKIASSQVGAALTTYSQSLQQFEGAWVDEIDLLIDDVAAAIVAHATVRRVDTLAAQTENFSNTDWRQEVADRGLVSLSREIDAERDRVQALLRLLDQLHVDVVQLESQELTPAERRERIVTRYRANVVESMATLDALIAAESNDQLRAELQRAKNNAVLESTQGPFVADPESMALYEIIVSLQAMRAAIPADMRNLTALVSAVRTAHESVDRWIQTDVTVPGEDLGQLVNAWSAAVGETR